MTAVDDLLAFVQAQLDEDERVAREVAALAPFDEWDAVGAQADDEAARSNWEVVRIARPPSTPAARSIAQHIARWDPARVLAEVEAKRRVLDEFGWEAGETRAITYLAQPYAGWPGWREEWAV